MLKADKRTFVITSIVTILPILAGMILWQKLPAVMATHIGTDNLANGFSSKAFAVFGIPLFCLAVQCVTAFKILNDPRKHNISPKMYAFVLWIIPIVSLYVAAMMYPFNLGYQMNISFYSEIFVGFMFVVIGNFLPKVRHNYTIGVRIPWTLNNEINWNRTNRLAGYLWAAEGVMIILLTLSGLMKIGWLIGSIAAAIMVPIIYSYLLYSRSGL